MGEWVAEIRIAEDVEAKIGTKHNLNGDQIRDAVLLGAEEEARWHNHPIYGRRLLLIGTDSGGTRILVYMRPVDQADGIWECLTAWKVN